MNIIDLHCDTLTEINKHGTAMSNNCHHFSLSRLPEQVGWLQFFAIFMPDELRGAAASEYFDQVYGCWKKQLQTYPGQLVQVKSQGDIDAAWQQDKCAGILTVEGGSALCGELERVAYLADCNVRMLTLTWNAQNEIGGGQAEDTVLTQFGCRVIPELENHNIIIDVSHLGDKAFWQLTQLVRRPLVASHSNSRKICPHGRNLTDEQFRWISRQNGLVGLVYCPQFISANRNDASVEQMARHLRHFIDLGGEDTVALGSDYDGTDVPLELDSPEKIPPMGERLVQMGFTPAQVEKLFYKNARAFLERYSF